MKLKIPSSNLLEEKIYLNALNIVFKNDFLKIYSSLLKYPSFITAFEEIAKNAKDRIDPFKEWEKLQKQNIDFIPYWEEEYPSLLKEIPSPPLGLYLKSEKYQRKDFSSFFSTYLPLAIVGTRKITLYGKRVLEKIIPELVNQNVLVVSGLAYGVDAFSHQLCIKNNGLTMAVLSSGVDQITPRGNYNIGREIEKNGFLISEYPLSTPSFKQYFPWRNRIISGLSRGTIVIEAPEKSGALITANFALEQNREVFALPGSIFNQSSLGCLRLIQNGAKLIISTNDILEEFDFQSPKTSLLKENKLSLLTEKEKEVYNILSSDYPTDFDQILKQVNFEAKEILTILSELEIKDLIKNFEGQYYKKD